MFVLKRLDDALAHGDQIYAIVAGIGLSNDIHGDLLGPQLRRSAPGHADGLRAGRLEPRRRRSDRVPRRRDAGRRRRRNRESQVALGQSGWNTGQCAIGSVKSNVGHALTAAGAAGLLKVLLALKHETLPPTANFERSAPGLGLDESPFRVLTHAEPWPKHAADRPRRAAISGFGFGGINCHLLLEEWAGAEPKQVLAPERSRSFDAIARRQFNAAQSR